MTSLILKSKNALIGTVEPLDFVAYKQRVIADGGMIVDEGSVKSAMAFCYAQGITDIMAFSVTSAAWGIKLSGGKPSKLYSLFNPDGDLDIVVGSSPAIDFADFESRKVLAMRGSSYNAVMSKGAANGVNTAGICVVAKPPTLASGTAYGPGVTFCLGELANIEDASSVADRAQKQILASLYLRSTAGKMPYEWDFRNFGFASTGAMTDTASDTAGWAKEAVYIGAAGMQVFNSGVKVQEDLVVAPSTYKDVLKFYIGRNFTPSVQNLSWTSPLYSNVAESWCLINTSADIMKAVSLRASQLY